MKHSPKNPREVDSLFRPIATDVRQTGSHRTYKFADGGILTVTQHTGEFGPKARRQIARLAVYYGLLTSGILVLLVVAGRMIA